MSAAAATAPSTWWRRRVLLPILEQLRQGITPEKIALTLALGLALGLFPILGSTTLLCAIAGVWLRLNQPIIQLVNYLASPLWLLLVIPYYRAGETLFGQPHVPIFSITDLAERFQASPLQFLVDYGMVGVYGIVAWMLTAPFIAGAIYYGSLPALKRLVPR